MELSGDHTFKASRETVYDVMHSKDALMHCLPGCEGMEETGPDAYKATLKVGVAGIKGTYVCTIVGTEANRPDTWTLTVQGSSKSGNLKGVGNFTLTEVEGGTNLHYAGTANLTGLLAGVGQRVIAPASRMIIGKFFDCIAGQMEQHEAGGARETAPSEATTAQ